MSIIEALNEIRSKPKWYYQSVNGKMVPKTNLIQTAQRIEHGLAKRETTSAFFAMFGYKVEINERVIKI